MPAERQTADRKIRLMCVDDDPFVRKGLALLLGLEPDLMVCGEAESEPQALERVPALKPDLAVVDLGLKEGTGLNLIKRLRQRCPELKILVFSTHDEAHYVAGAFAAGAHGYVTKDEGTEKMLEAIHVVMSGKSYLTLSLSGAKWQGGGREAGRVTAAYGKGGPLAGALAAAARTKRSGAFVVLRALVSRRAFVVARAKREVGGPRSGGWLSTPPRAEWLTLPRWSASARRIRMNVGSRLRPGVRGLRVS